MTSLEKKAVQHTISTLKQVETHPVWQFVYNSLIDGQYNEVLRKRLLDGLSDVLTGSVKKHVNEATDWLTELLKNEA